MTASPLEYARIDADGLIVSILMLMAGDPAAMAGDVVPAPRGALTAGSAWRWNADLGWQQVVDRRGAVYVDPATDTEIRITRVLQQPPEGWVLLDAAGQALRYARAHALDLVELERQRRTVAPIQYGGARLDADATAQRNVSAKLLELQQAQALGIETPPQLLVWRDHDNVTHTFADQAALAAWLGGLAVAISQRGTEAYAWAWATKAAIQGAADLQAIHSITATLTTETTAA